MRRILIFAGAMLAAGIFASAAQASTVTLDTTSQEGDQDLVYRANPGETNDVTIVTNGAREYVGWLVSDNGAPLTAGDGCKQIDEHTASCPFTESEVNISVDANLGDGNDFASVTLACGVVEDESDFPCEQVIAHGGEGNDVIYAGGTIGLNSTTAIQKAFGDAGDDYLFSGQSGSTLDGGDGNDTLRGVNGPDRLLGRAGDDRIDGHAGNDVIRGQGGDDDLHGGYGRDTLNGGSGHDIIVGGVDDDTLWAADGRRDHVDGSFGNDRANVDGSDVVNSVERRH